MALGDRSVDFILKAQVDQATRPLVEVVQRIKDLIAVLNSQGDAATKGETTVAHYGKALRDVEKAAGDFLRLRSQFEAFGKAQENLDAKLEIVAQKRAARDAKEAAAPPLSDRTDKQQAAIDRLTRSMEGSERAAGRVQASYARVAAELERLGVITEGMNRDQQRAAIEAADAIVSANIREVSSTLTLRQAQSDQLLQILKTAQVQRQAAEQRERDIAGYEREKQAVLDAAEAIRARGRATQEAVNLQSPLNARRFDVEQAFLEADAAERAQKAMVDGAKALQAEQDKTLRSAMALWEAEVAGAEKARLATEAFRVTVQTALASARAGLANAGTQAGALGVPVALPAPTLAQRVQNTLAPPPGPGAAPTDFRQLQAQVEQLGQTLAAGKGALADYTREVRNLGLAQAEIVRQSKIVDAFRAADLGARAAVAAFREAVAELKRLEGELATIADHDKQRLTEVTSAVEAQKRLIGSIDAGRGLASDAREAQEQLARETQALNSIGIATDEVAVAQHRLTVAARQASEARVEIYRREQAEFQTAALNAQSKIAGANNLLLGPTAPPPSTVSQQIGGLLPGRGAAEITDADGAINRLENTLAKGRQTAQAFNRTMDELFQVQAKIAGDAALVDAFNQQSAAVLKAEQAYVAARESLFKLSQATEVTSATTRELRQAEATLDTTSGNLQRQLQQQAAIDAQLKARRVDTANLTAETGRLITQAQRLAQVEAGFQAQSARRGSGLSSYQLQNLQFQVNDVVTQLSLGQGVLRTFESQAGQIFQIFDLTGAALLRFAIIAAPVAIAIGVIVAALSRLKDTADATRQFNAFLLSNVDGIKAQGAALTDTARSIERYGVSFGEATSAVQTFLRNGMDPKRILEFGKAARDLADARGGSFADAVKQLTTIQTGSFEDIRKLDQELNFLTADQLKYIRSLFDAGNAELGRIETLDRLREMMKRGADEGVSELAKQFRGLTEAWNGFLDAIGKSTVLQNLISQITGLLTKTGELVKILNGDWEGRGVKEVTSSLGEMAFKITINTTGLGIVYSLVKKISDLVTSTLGGTTGGATPGGEAGNLFVGDPSSGVKENTGGGGRGAVGMFQLRQDAARSVGLNVPRAGMPFTEEGRRGDDRYDYQKNIQGGVDYFKQLLDQQKTTFDALQRYFGSNDPAANRAYAASVQRQDLSSVDPRVVADITAAFERTFKDYPGGDKAQVLQTILQLAKQESGANQFKGPIPRGDAGVSRGSRTGATEGPGQFGPPAPLSQPDTEAARKANDAVIEKIQRDQLNDYNTLLRGEERLKQDMARVDAFRKQKMDEAIKSLNGQPISTQATAALEEQVKRYSDTLQQKREKEVSDANNAALQIFKSAQEAVLKSDKTNPEAQRQAVDIDFAGRLAQLDVQIRNGATDVARQSLEGARAAIIKLRDQARDKATVDADRAIVETIVKTRDDLVAALTLQLNQGAISLREFFDRLGAILKEFGPRVQTALDRSNIDLRKQPQTPAVTEQLARNTAVDTTSQKIVTAADESALKRITDLEKERSNVIIAQNELVKLGAVTRSAADEKIQSAYDRTTPKIKEIISDMKTQLDLQLQFHLITQEAYDLYIAKLQRAGAETEHLTEFQQKLTNTIATSVAGNAVQALDTVTTAIGAAIAKTGTWADVWKSLGVASAQFVAQVLKDVAKMILEYELLAVIRAALGIPSVGVAHSGGIAGSLTTSRPVNPAVFAIARRFHNGGMLGLAPDEVPAILQRGEEVLTKSDPRHRSNFGGTAQDNGVTAVRNVILFDDSQVAGAMSGAAGEKVLFSFLKRNAASVRQLVGSK